MAKTTTVTSEQIRAWRWKRQGVGAMKKASAAEILERAGWMRSVGGAGPYLGLFARGRLSRAEVDAQLAKLEIHELPSARGCTYVVPKSEFALALRTGQGHGDAAELATAKKYLGVTDAEVEKLCARILDLLDAGPADPAELKDKLGAVVRHRGDAGKKRGMTTTLPLGIGRLQSAGEIRRVPIDGRLDRQRYRYARWKPNPLAKMKLDDEAVAVELARRFFRWAGPATVAQLAWWAGLGARAAKAAAASLALEPVGAGDERLLLASDLDEVRATRPTASEVGLVGSLDNLFHPRREVASMLDEPDAALKLPQAKSTVGALSDLDNHAIVMGGRLIGLWDYDADAQKIVWATFGRVKADVAGAVAEMESFVRDQLGDARSFSLDSPESRVGRLKVLRAMSR
jgi:hypothetical protein